MVDSPRGLVSDSNGARRANASGSASRRRRFAAPARVGYPLMRGPRTTAPLGADSVLHPLYLRDALRPVLDAKGNTSPTPDDELYVRLRTMTRLATASIGAAHPGHKGRAVHRVKVAIHRVLYWYVEPAFSALRETNLALVDLNESLSDEVTRLGIEVAYLRREYNSIAHCPVAQDTAIPADP